MPRSKNAPAAAPAELPGPYLQFIQDFPELGAVHDQIGELVGSAGALDPKTCELIKIGICVGAGLESALRSHLRRALRQGATRAEAIQAILQGMSTVGFPRTVAAWTWARRQFERDRDEQT